MICGIRGEFLLPQTEEQEFIVVVYEAKILF